MTIFKKGSSYGVEDFKYTHFVWHIILKAIKRRAEYQNQDLCLKNLVSNSKNNTLFLNL